MRKMNSQERKWLEGCIREIMILCVSSEYTNRILDHVELGEDNEPIGKTFLEDVIQDVMKSSAWEEEGYYNEDDIRLAIGRAFMDRLDLWS